MRLKDFKPHTTKLEVGMTEFRDILKAHASAYPLMQPQDVVKLCFQAANGAEHLLCDRAKARLYLIDEFEHTALSDLELAEKIGDDYSRINIAAWKKACLPPEWLFEIFYMTASQPMPEKNKFNELIDEAKDLVKDGIFGFDLNAWNNYWREYTSKAEHAVHHSEIYRNAYAPSYRVVKEEYARLLLLLIRINECMQNAMKQERAAIVAIDGRAAAGKSTLAGVLENITGAGLVHMDDFFLPPGLRSAKRLAEPGGNVHYERFREEVLPHLRGTESFCYRRFDCSEMDYAGMRKVNSGSLRIVEGSYCCHPYFGEYMDLAIFCDVTYDEQLRRIELRNGKEAKKMFVQRWIPMEEAYFKAFSVKNHADALISHKAICF